MSSSIFFFNFLSFLLTSIKEFLFVLLAGLISHTSTQYMDFVEIFNIVLDLSTTYFSHF